MSLIDRVADRGRPQNIRKGCWATIFAHPLRKRHCDVLSPWIGASAGQTALVGATRFSADVSEGATRITDASSPSGSEDSK